MKVPQFKKTFHIFKDLQFVAEKVNEVIKQTNKHDDELIFLKRKIQDLEERLSTKSIASTN